VTTLEARRKYRVNDISGLRWVPHPYRGNFRYYPSKTRYYLESDVRAHAVREKGGPHGFRNAHEAWQTRMVTRRRNNLVRHYRDLASLGRDFETQAFLAGLDLLDCIDVRTELESPQQRDKRLFVEEANRQLSLLSRLLPWKDEMTDDQYEDLCLRYLGDRQSRLSRLEAVPPLATNQAYAAYKHRALHNACYESEKLGRWIPTWPS
jgi:hypothetical protein